MSFISCLLDRLDAWIDEINTALDVDFGDDE